MNRSGYSEAYSSRSRGRIAVEHSSFTRSKRCSSCACISPLARSDSARCSNGIPTDLLLSLVLVKSLSALAHHVAKTWLLGQGLSALALTSGLLLIASPAIIAVQRPWSGARTGVSHSPSLLFSWDAQAMQGPSVFAYGLALLGEIVTLCLALQRLSVLRSGSFSCCHI
jgi:hypothetical protein